MSIFLVLLGFLVMLSSLGAAVALNFGLQPPLELVFACPIGFGLVVLGAVWERCKVW
jgi:hypothetical protein